MDFHLWSLEETIKALKNKHCSAKELTEALLTRVNQHNPTLHAYITVCEDALSHAERIDEIRMKNPESLGILQGALISLKDLFDTPGIQTTYGGGHFKGHLPKVPATVVQKLKSADAIIIGKTNLHEYAYGTTNANPHYGKTLNPWNRSKIPGGSSGGSAVSVCAGLASASLGTDTGGSVRIPAALTGVVGLKPTFGLISKSGVFPLAYSLDHVGPITKTVRDATILLDLLAGYDALDATSVVSEPMNYFSGSATKPIRVGIPRQFFFDKCHPGVSHTVSAGLRVLETSIIQTIDIDVPHIESVPEAQNTIISAEALAIHEKRLTSEPQLFGEDVRQRLVAGRTITGAQYVRAMEFRRLFRRDVISLFEKVDIIVTPTTPLLATDVGQSKAPLGVQEIPVGSHLTRYTNPWNLCGLPAISIPCGTSGGLPVGMQLIGPPFSERKLLAIAAMFEQVFHLPTTAPDYQ